MTESQMKLQDDDYNEKEKDPNTVGLVEQAKKDWSVELVKKVCLDQRLAHPRKISVGVREKRWTLGKWRMMVEWKRNRKMVDSH